MSSAEQGRFQHWAILTIITPAIFWLAGCSSANASSPTSLPTPTPIPNIQCGDIPVPLQIMKREGTFQIPYDGVFLTGADPLGLLERYFGCRMRVYPKFDKMLPENAPYPFTVEYEK